MATQTAVGDIRPDIRWPDSVEEVREATPVRIWQWYHNTRRPLCHDFMINLAIGMRYAELFKEDDANEQ